MRIQYINICFYRQVLFKCSFCPPFFHFLFISPLHFFMFSSFPAFSFDSCSPLPFHLSHFNFFFPLRSSVHTSYLSITFVSFVSCFIFDKFFYSWNPLTSQLPPNFMHKTEKWQLLLLTILQYSANWRPQQRISSKCLKCLRLSKKGTDGYKRFTC